MSGASRWNLRRVFRVRPMHATLKDDVDAELAFHLQGRAEELMTQGLPRDEAEREARRRFGDYAHIEHEVERVTRHAERRRTIRDRVQALAADVRYAARSLARQPLFATVVVVTLTLGIGSTAAMFHAVDRVVLHPLPYPDAGHVVYLGMRWGKGPPVGALPAGRFQFWHDHARSFDGLATSQTFDATFGSDDSGMHVDGIRVTPDFLRVIGTTPAIGRAFAPRDFVADAPPVAILSHGLWTTQLGSAPNVLWRTVHLDGRAYTVIGVLPASFEIAELATPPAVMLPLVLTPAQLADAGANYTSVGRLRPGLTDAQIAGDMAAVFAAWKRAFPEHVEPDDFGVAVMTYDQIFAANIVSLLWVLLGATAFVLLLACANVTNLVLARTLARQRELAVRVALGAGRGRIVRQVVVEMLLLGLVSAVLATAASLGTVRGLSELARGALLRTTQLRLDPRVLALTAITATVVCIVIGLVAAMVATRGDMTSSLAASARGGGAGGPTGHGRLRGLLVAVESALAMVLLAGAGLLISSFVKVLGVDGGFRREGIYTARVAQPPRDYDRADVDYRFEQRVLAMLSSTPGVVAAGATATLPLERGMNLSTTVEGHPERTQGATEWRAISPGYLRTMNVSLVAGRDIAETDVSGAPLVTLVSEAYAKSFFPGENPIGRRIFIGCYKGCPDRPVKVAYGVVGVVRDLRDMSLEQRRPRQTVWVPLAQLSNDFATVPAFVVRANSPSVAAGALRRAITSAEPRMGVPDVLAMSDIVSQSLSWRRFSLVVMVSFAALALVLTCVGIYGVASYAVSRRVREIGVRMALGARPGSVIALVLGQGIRPTVVGLVIGLGIALLLSKVLARLLFGVGPRDPLSLGATAAVLLGVATLASYFPARRAARIDPAGALRIE